jgi:hydroxypyruvate reductase
VFPDADTDPAVRRALAERIFRAAVAAVDPVRLTERGVATLGLGRSAGRIHLLAIGKAAPGMAVGAMRALAAGGVPVAGGIVVGADDGPPLPGLARATGDHPLPGPASVRAAVAIEAAASEVRPGDTALVLLSGGASSLVGAPVDGVALADLATLTQLLLGAGVDIETINAMRRRVSRLGAGRLARRLAPARIVRLTISDVPGFDDDVIGSGPCSPDPSTAAELIARLRAEGLWACLPDSVGAYLSHVEAGRRAETAKPGDPAFQRLERVSLASNRTACEAAVKAARRRALAVPNGVEALESGGANDARAQGARLGEELVAQARSAPGARWCRVLGGEPAMRLAGAPADALGGRMQAFALAAARALHAGGEHGRRVTILAAGTDGRDGPTDAAGAIIDAESWAKIAAGGRNPASDLELYRAYRSLDSVGTLLRTGPTGTNVADVVVAIVGARR